ncbi:MAG: thioredoxin [Candidatus Electryoneaceae bacterium]|nr:thioredoxin [Candidatus Electryoneaceae bacterium]
MHNVKDVDFDSEVVESDRLTVVDFGGKWCGPCKKLDPIMEEIAEQYGDRIKVVSVDVEEAPQTAMKYGVTGIPRLMFFSGGIVKETVIGLIAKSKIKHKIDQHLDNS